MIGSVRAEARAGASAAARMLAWRVHAYESDAASDSGRGPQLEEARVPPLLAPDELLVEVRAASINPIDLAMIEGYGATALNAQRRLLGAGAAQVEFPLTCGRDFCGVVRSRGSLAGPQLRRGARVWGALPPHATQGAHAQLVRVKREWVSLAPSALDDVECAGAPYAALSAMALLRAAALPPPPSAPRVLLLGMGGVGQAALQLLVARGARVTVGAKGEVGALATKMGASEALDRHSEEYWARVEGGGPYEAVLDCAGLGGEEAGARSWRFERFATLTSPLLRETDARGLLGGAVASASRLLSQSVRLPPPPSGSSLASCWPRVRWAFFSARAQDLEMLRRLADRGQFRVGVERRFAWRDAAAAYAHARRGNARGKIVLDFSDDTPPASAPAPAPVS